MYLQGWLSISFGPANGLSTVNYIFSEIGCTLFFLLFAVKSWLSPSAPSLLISCRRVGLSWIIQTDFPFLL